MSEPRWGNPPKIALAGGMARVTDHGDWSTQEDTKPQHFCFQWFLGWTPVAGNSPPERTRPDYVMPGRELRSIPIYPAWVGGELFVRAWGGREDDYGPGEGVWIDWGSQRSDHRDIPADSNRLPIGPQPPTNAELLRATLLELEAAIGEAEASLAVRLGWARSRRSLEHARAAHAALRRLA